MDNNTIKTATLEALRRMLRQAHAHQARRGGKLEDYARNTPLGLLVGCCLDEIGATEESIIAALLELEEEGLVRCLGEHRLVSWIAVDTNV